MASCMESSGSIGMLDRVARRIFNEMADGMFKRVFTGRFEGRGRSSSQVQHGAISALASINCVSGLLLTLIVPQFLPI